MIREVVSRPALAKALLGRDKWGNPFDPEVVADPYSTVHLALQDGPVAYRRLYQQWFVMGYDEAKEVLNRSDLTSGGQIDTLNMVRPYSQLSERSKLFFKTILPVTDPPVHPRLRSLVSRAFTPKRMEGLEAGVERLVDDLFTSMPTDGLVDVRQHFSVPLPINVIADMFGMPKALWPWVRDVTTRVVQLLDPFVAFDPADVDAAIDELYDVYGRLADERMENPTDDLLTALVQAEEDGERLSRDELIAMVATIMGAGFETTSGVLGASIIHLAANPDQRDLIRSRPELWPNAVEELLRFDTPVRVSGRQATVDFELGGETIKKGSNIIVSLFAAHRDPRHYEEPFELRLDRPNPRPLSFGHGVHHCLGSALARMEIRIGLQRFLDEFGDYSVEDHNVDWRPSTTLRNQSRLLVSRG